MRKSLPNNFDFFELFEKQAGYAVEAATTFKEITETGVLLLIPKIPLNPPFSKGETAFEISLCPFLRKWEKQKRGAHPLLPPKSLGAARLARFERATSGFEVHRSIHLSYRRSDNYFQYLLYLTFLSFSDSYGLEIFPANNTRFESSSMIKNKNGWSARNTFFVSGLTAVIFITTPVTAAASEPSSFTSRYDF